MSKDKMFYYRQANPKQIQIRIWSRSGCLVEGASNHQGIRRWVIFGGFFLVKMSYMVGNTVLFS